MVMRIVNGLRWGVLALGFLIVLVFLVFAMGEQGHGPLLLTWKPEALITWSLLLWSLSILVGVKWLRVGALMGLAGVCAFYAINYTTSGHIPSGPIFPLMWIPPVTLLLTSFCLRSQGQHSPAADDHAS